MLEYRVKGLSCANCTREMEEQIQRLEHGGSATLNYNSGKLKIDPKVALPEVQKILRSDGASIDSVAPRSIRAGAKGVTMQRGRGASGTAEAALGQSKEQVSAALETGCIGCGADHDHSRGEHHGAHAHADGERLSDDAAHDHAVTHSHSAGQTAASHHARKHDHEHGAAHEHMHDHEHGDDDHGHDHSHAHGGASIVRQLVVSAALYGAALLLEGRIPGFVSILLYVAAIALSGYGTFIKGLKRLARLRFNMDTLMTIALIGAVSIGEWKEATMVAILFGINEFLEGIGMEKARRSMETLLQVAPKQAMLVENGIERLVPIESLQAGDTVLVRAGEKIPSDGYVLEGISSVNEAAITGESLPLDKSAGDRVFGGSINHDGALRIHIDKAYEDSSLAQILHLVQEAQETKTPTELFINRFAKYYTPAIMIIALLVALFPPLFLNGDWRQWLYQGLAVLIVGCPCALILASPIAIVAGITRNARHGILVKGGVFLEQLGRIDTLAFDKTGTLTRGEPHVEQTVVYDRDEERFYRVAAAIEQASSHPLAKAIVRETGKRGVQASAPEEVTAASGLGIQATLGGERYWLGNEANISHVAMPDEVKRDIERFKASGLTLVIVADSRSVLGLFGIADEIRPESASVVAALHRRGIRRTVMLTGDHPQTAEKVARAVGVTSFVGGLLPEDKVAKIRELGRGGRVAMVGDGINDAPALATAELGIAMGKGTDSAIETADIVLMQDHLGKLPEAISIARRTNRIIRINITIAMGLKLAALLLTIPGMLTLWFAILSDMGATIIISLLSLTMLIERKEKK
ncbi:heavy metal translocating P-type ATPase [Paenibacillus doosanensis]|uniref:heavy metal translocating P-type ATPase n=1 Tax=Paenibacillus doosanensis TaxID=1229154 RepID=UPI00217F8499|nr:heavy metal translocating P-type ATPase [Paenibacillus doosanensis]